MALHSTLACDGGMIKFDFQEIPEKSHPANDMTFDEYKKTLQHFEKFFGPSIEELTGAELQVIVSWKSNTINAFAERSGKNWLITVYGGLARHKAITLDGLNLVLCHELGHHDGGYPKKTTNRWSSAEGQADYYSTTKCLRKLWAREDNVSIIKNQFVPPSVVLECSISFSTPEKQALCERISLAGKSVALMFQDLDRDSIEPQFDTPDDLITRRMVYIHPFAQCRLDTYFNGSVCPVSELINFDDENEKIGACHPLTGHSKGNRPLCWFVPKNR